MNRTLLLGAAVAALLGAAIAIVAVVAIAGDHRRTEIVIRPLLEDST